MKLLKKIYYIIEFMLFYLIKIIQSNVFIAIDILTPKLKVSPGTINYQLAISSPTELLLLNNLISMTPGTISLDLSDDRKTMKIHLLNTKKKEKSMEEIEQLEKRILRILR